MQVSLHRIAPRFILPTIILALTILVIHTIQITTAYFDNRAPLPSGAQAFFIVNQLRPEPFKIPIFVLTVSITATLIVLARKPLQHLEQISLRASTEYFIFGAFCFLLGYFLWLIGAYPMLSSTEFSVGRTLVSICYTLFWCLVIFGLPFLAEKRKIKKAWLIPLVVIVLLVLATYIPTNPVEPYDYSYLIGPAVEVARGKTIYTQAPSQYGLGYTFLFALAEKLIPGSLLSLPNYIWLIYIIEVFTLFGYVRATTKSLRAGLLIAVASLTLSFFSLLSTPFGIPQVGAFRWLQFLFTFLLIVYYEEKSPRRLWVILPIAFMACLVVDVGLEMSIGLCAYWGLRFLAGKLSFMDAAKKFVTYVISIGVVLALLAACSFLLGGSWIDFGLALHTVRQYGIFGFGMLPLDQRTFYWIYFLTMIASFFIYARAKTETTWHRAVLLSALFLMAGSIYMMGRSHPHNMFNISRLWLLNFFVLLTPLIQRVEKLPTATKYFVYGIGVLLLVFMPAFCRQQNLSHLLREKLGRSSVLRPYLPASIVTKFTVDFERNLPSYRQAYAPELQMIEETFPEPGTPIAIFALNDTFYHYLSGHPSLLWSNPINMIIQQSELDQALTPLRMNGCPEKIAFDQACIEKETCHRSQDDGVLNAQDRVFQGFIRLCGRYEAIRCTQKMCIGQRVH